jgi:hypothetical protein
MPIKTKAKLDQYFHDELIETLAHQTGLSASNLRASIHFSILASVYQMKFRLQQTNGALVTYKMAKVAAGAEITRHLPAIFNKNGHYQGIINMTSVLFNGDFSKIEKMLQERYELSEDGANRILVMSACGTISILGETIRDRKLRMEGFREMLNLKVPLYTEALSSGLNFPFEHWEAKAAELQNQLFRAQSRRKRSAEKKSRFSLPFKWFFILLISVGIVSALYVYA